MKNKIYLFIAVLATLVLSLGVTLGYLYLRQPKIAYVRSHDLIESFQGTREARQTFEQRKNGMMLNVDSLKIDFERQRNSYVNSMKGLTAVQRAEREENLNQQQSRLLQYSKAVEQQVADEDNKMMQEVLNQINSFVEEFAIREGYSYIFGTTLSGNLLYGKSDNDITDRLVTELNNRYKGK